MSTVMVRILAVHVCVWARCVVIPRCCLSSLPHSVVTVVCILLAKNLNAEWLAIIEKMDGFLPKIPAPATMQSVVGITNTVQHRIWHIDVLNCLPFVWLLGCRALFSNVLSGASSSPSGTSQRSCSCSWSQLPFRNL